MREAFVGIDCLDRWNYEYLIPKKKFKIAGVGFKQCWRGRILFGFEASSEFE